MRYLIFGLALLITSCNSDREMLKLQPVMGTSYWQKASTISILQQTIEGQTINIQTEYITDIRLIPQVINEKNIIMSAQFRDLRFNVESPFGKMSFDSRRPDTSDFAAIIFSRLNKTPFNVHFIPNGEVRRIEGMDDVMNNAFTAVNMSTQQRAEVSRMLSDVYGEEAIKSHLEMSAAILPNKAVSVGDSWSLRTPYHGSIKGIANHTYTLKEKRKDGITIQGKSSIEPNPNYRGNNRYDVYGSLTSYFNVDPKTGWATSGVIEMEFNGRIHTQNPDGGDIEIPMKMEGKTEIRADQL